MGDEKSRICKRKVLRRMTGVGLRFHRNDIQESEIGAGSDEGREHSELKPESYANLDE